MNPCNQPVTAASHSIQNRPLSFSRRSGAESRRKPVTSGTLRGRKGVEKGPLFSNLTYLAKIVNTTNGAAYVEHQRNHPPADSLFTSLPHQSHRPRPR